MPFWGGYWAQPWGGFGWIFPLIGMLFMIVMVFVCIRMMGGTMGGMGTAGCMGSHRGQSADQTADLQREIQELKEEVRRLRGGSGGGWLQGLEGDEAAHS